ncbi:RagB/SusD family nutrient uptake outer membrane protein [Chitinophaga sp. GbtcB8]|uniref:RagB/SusD family nutrient uptake outer membrane protein n=1 Tax=Chitinophaga sp. GbtcB8 TaxID=2824753 RepID=UPI001C30FFD3|nr:RagB/SusD family nutrient uptake outer membrane protein [Chitinophaga sp. GbtcB8]
MKIIQSQATNTLTRYSWVLVILFDLIFSSCRKLVEVQPPYTQLNSDIVFSDDATATSAMFSIFSQMSSDMLTYNMSLYPGLSADEFINYSPELPSIQFYSNSLSADNTINGELWTKFYSQIYQANNIIESLAKAPNITAGVKQQLMGEAYFTRAYLYFYLVNYYGEIPLVITTNYKINATVFRSSTTEVYKQIEIDLQQAQKLLATYFVGVNGKSESTERLRPTIWAANALLSRMYLYTKNWEKAIEYSSTLINRSDLFSLEEDLNHVFLKNSREAIWQITLSPYNTMEGPFFTLTTTPSSSSLSNRLTDAFESNDKRYSSWVGTLIDNGQTYHYPFKYKVFDFESPVSEYTMILRLAEQHLIRAESYAQMGDLNKALSDLNVIRKRAELPDFTSSSKEQIIAKIQHERQIELFSELGHRWLDLKRTGDPENILAAVASEKGGAWSSNWLLYPIPQNERSKNHNLSQNLGY